MEGMYVASVSWETWAGSVYPASLGQDEEVAGRGRVIEQDDRVEGGRRG